MNRIRVTSAAALLAVMAACTAPAPGAAPGDIHDPYEEANRKRHAFNKGLDKAVVGPVGRGYSNAVPDGAEKMVSNFADTVSQPRNVVNQLLQGRVLDAGRSTLRFAMNATMGFGGLGDPATAAGLPSQDTNFGETLAVWGFREGAYLELPVLGPSTERDAAGKVVDLFLNPLRYILPSPESVVPTVAKAADGLGKRGQFDSTISGVLYNSADSYAQLRAVYLQNSRFDLGNEVDSQELDLELDTEGF